MQELRRYVYFQCLPKLEERFGASVPGLSRSFEEVFEDLEPEAVLRGWVEPTPPLPADLDNSDEKWLIEDIINDSILMSKGLLRSEIAETNASGVEQLRISPLTARLTLESLQSALRWVRYAIDELKKVRAKKYTGRDAADSVPEVSALLDHLDVAMEILHSLTHQSRSMWYMIQGSAVMDACTKMVRICVQII